MILEVQKNGNFPSYGGSQLGNIVLPGWHLGCNASFANKVSKVSLIQKDMQYSYNKIPF